jgi:multidrug efflux pump subunit AcrB
MVASAFRTRVVLLTLLGVTALAGVAVAAFYLGVWLVPRGPAPGGGGPILRVTALYEGAPAPLVEATVTVPLERELIGLEGLESIESFSREGEAALTLYLRPGTDINLAQVMAQNRVSLALARIPGAVQKQGVSVLKRTPLPVLWVLVGSPDQGRDPLYLRRAAEFKLRPPASTLGGVWEVAAGPGPGPRTHVRLDPEKLADHRLSFADVLRDLRFRLDGLLEKPEHNVTADQLAELIVGADAGGQAVRLTDVGEVKRAGGEPGGVACWQGDPVAFLAVEGKDPVRLCQDVAEHFPLWRGGLGRGVELHLLPGPAVPETEALLVEGRLPAAANSEEVDDMAGRVATALQRLPDPKAEHLLSAVLALPAEQPTMFRLYVALCPSSERAASLAEVAERVRQELKEYGDLVSRVTSPSVLERPPWRRAPLVLRVSGPEAGPATQLADEVFDRLSRGGVVTDLWPDYTGLTPPRLQLDVDADRANRFGVRVEDVLATLQVFRGPQEVEKVAPGVVVELRPEGQDRVRDVNQLQVRNDKGEMVPLGALAAVRAVRGPAVLHRLDGQRCLLISASPAPGVSVEEAGRRCRATAAQARDDLGLPEGYKLECLEPGQVGGGRN